MAGKPGDVATRGGGPPHRMGGAGGPRVMVERAQRPTGSQRWRARLAFAAAIAAVVVLLLFGGLKSITVLLLGFAGLPVACAAAWWFLANRGIVRWLALVALAAVPVSVIVVYVVAGLVALAVVLAAAAVAAGRAALSSGDASAGPPEYAAAHQRQPFMIMNPRSGGGKVGKFGLRPDDLHTFKVLPRRWVAGRTLSWITRHRRTVRDYERLPAHHDLHLLGHGRC